MTGKGFRPRQIDVEQAVTEIGALHLDVVGELKTALEGARRFRVRP